MNKDSVIDSLSCILFKGLGFFIRFLPVRLSLFLGRRLGDFLYCFDLRHRSIAYAHIKKALGHRLNCHQILRLTRDFYQSFGQNLMEIFFIPFLNKAYINKYVQLEGREFIREAFSNGKGLILLSVHAGSWELSNVISTSLDFDFNLLVRDQRHPRLNELLNQYRSHWGCKIIQRKNQTRDLIKALKRNEAIGMTMDQGGKTGNLATFFGREASMATGAVRLALKYGSPIIPGYYTRVKGPAIKTIFKAPYHVKKSEDREKDIQDNLQELVHLFEKEIERFPQDYFWLYKIWKYGRQRKVLILSDGKAGHLRQSQALAKILRGVLSERKFTSDVEVGEVKFKNVWFEKGFRLASCLSGKYQCQGCLRCLKAVLQKESYDSLSRINPDIIISCGSSVAPVNYILSRQNLARSVVVMHPALSGTRRFDLVIIPGHDRPARKKNILVTEGALNLIDEEYLEGCVSRIEPLLRRPNDKPQEASGRLMIGLLIGGDSKEFRLRPHILRRVSASIKEASQKLDADILVTTSRRTSKEGEAVVKGEFAQEPRCKFLVIANEKNIPDCLGGILGLSQVVVCSPESFSMISEAISSKKYVFVFDERGLRQKQQRYLEHFARAGYIYLSKTQDLAQRIQDVWTNRPAVRSPDDSVLIKEALATLL
ncbi:MAG: ELM1/GtrOC1 family putative glycosyltransferase [Candidatus Omnitrophota bacterium]